MLASDEDADLFAKRPADVNTVTKMDSRGGGSVPCRRRRSSSSSSSERCSLFALFLVLLLAGAQAASVPSRRTLAASSGANSSPQSTSVHQHRHHHHAKPSKSEQCAWTQWESDPLLSDVAGTRAYLAPVVFEGKARSRSDGPVYRVTFDVVQVFKGDVAPGSQVRLEFAKPADSALRSLGAGSRRSAGTAVLAEPVVGKSGSRSSGRTTSARDSHSSSSSISSVRPRRPATSNNQLHHSHHHRHHGHQSKCLVTAEIRTGRHYLVFANRWGPNNFTTFGSPIVPTKRSLKDVRSTLCPRCGESVYRDTLIIEGHHFVREGAFSSSRSKRLLFFMFCECASSWGVATSIWCFGKARARNGNRTGVEQSDFIFGYLG